MTIFLSVDSSYGDRRYSKESTVRTWLEKREKITAPWTEEQVEALKKHQANLQIHPYTCDCGEILVPTTEGWACGKCPYRQNWAHDPSSRFSAIVSPRSWPDPGENGQYLNRCSRCRQQFMGHKRRIICRECAHGFPNHLEEEVWVVVQKRTDGGCPKLCKSVGSAETTNKLEMQGSLIFFIKSDAEYMLANLTPEIRKSFEVRQVLARIA